MFLKRSVVVNIALALAVASALLFLHHKGLLKRLELMGMDSYFHLRGVHPSNPRIVIVEIDDYDIAKIGQWPWKRSWYAAITRALTELGAKSIYFDIIFAEPSIEEDDALFEEAIRISKNVYLPFAFQGTSFDATQTVFPLERFSKAAFGTGAMNIYADVDGTLRKIPLAFRRGSEVIPHMVLKLAMDDQRLGIAGITNNRLTLANDTRTVTIPMTGRNEMLINWAGRWEETFKHYDFLEVLAAYQDLREGRRSKINPREIKNSIAIVAVTAIGLYDIKPIPLQPEYPGVGVVANALNNILNRDFLRAPPEWVNLLLLFILSLIPALLISGEKPLRESIAIFTIGGVYLFVSYALFRSNILIDFVPQFLGLLSSHLIVETYNFIRISVERQTFFTMSITDGLTGLYNIRYFKMLLQTDLMLAGVDRNKKLAIVMSDVDHFKKFNDTYGHQVGDLVLKGVANVLKGSVRSYDIVARYGGEEMIILLRGSSLDDAITIAEKVRKNVEHCTVKDPANTYKVTISLGVSFFQQGDTVDSIIKRADDGLYKAKTSGRNCVSTVQV